MLVHFPVAAWTVATGLLLFAPLEPAEPVAVFALYANVFGILTGVPAMLVGLGELPALPRERELRDAVARHLWLAGSAWLTYCAVWLLQLRTLRVAAAAAALTGFALLLLAGHAGARVVYHHGFPPPVGRR